MYDSNVNLLCTCLICYALSFASSYIFYGFDHPFAHIFTISTRQILLLSDDGLSYIISNLLYTCYCELSQLNMSFFGFDRPFANIFIHFVKAK